MVEHLSPVHPVLRLGRYGHLAEGVGVKLTETQPGSIVQLAAWQGEEKAMMRAIKQVAGLAMPDGAGSGVCANGKAAFGFAPGRFMVIGEDEGLAAAFGGKIADKTGTVTDLSHGRTGIRISGPRAEWILAKLFAIDFSTAAFPAGSGISTSHHEIFAQIQRSGPDQFDLYVFRSFARSFWHSLCRASEEVGYEVT